VKRTGIIAVMIFLAGALGVVIYNVTQGKPPCPPGQAWVVVSNTYVNGVAVPNWGCE